MTDIPGWNNVPAVKYNEIADAIAWATGRPVPNPQQVKNHLQTHIRKTVLAYRQFLRERQVGAIDRADPLE